ncbi:MAG: 3-phosphoshikimate 1-carboxyvinyltransferase, partial [Victivallaceae bacterium]
MKIRVSKSTVGGEIAVPGSKSHTIRGIAAGLMADGVSIIYAPLESEDTLSTLRAAELLGAKVEKSLDCWKISGTGGKLRNPGQVIDMGNSGTGLRIISALAATAGFSVSFDGDASLRTRLMAPVLDALNKLGVKSKSINGKCPLTVQGPLSGGETEVEGKSSQFLTALLFAAPYALQDTEIKVFNLNEKPYVEITHGWLHRLGIEFENTPDMSLYRVKAGQKFNPFEWTIPADFSTAAFPLGAAALAGSGLKIRNLDFSDLQGDKAVFDYFEKMGVCVKRGPEFTEIGSARKLRGIDIDLNATPDALPIMAAVAAIAEGTTRLLNVPQARIKETDRIDCM